MNNQSLSISLIQEVSTQRTETFHKLEGDWQRQIEEINRIGDEVKKWQRRLNDAFRNGDFEGDIGVSSEPNLLISIKGIIQLSESKSLANYTPKFNGAIILQGMQVTQLEESVQVHYTAMLKTDENYFLDQILPETVKVVNKDPDYPLYDLTVIVPRGNLVKESLHHLSVHMNRPGPFITTRIWRRIMEQPFLLIIGVFGTLFIVTRILPLLIGILLK